MAAIFGEGKILPKIGKVQFASDTLWVENRRFRSIFDPQGIEANCVFAIFGKIFPSPKWRPF